MLPQPPQPPNWLKSNPGRALVLGFSARSAAQATAANGWHVTAFDHFGDSDTRAASDRYSHWDFQSSGPAAASPRKILSQRLNDLLSPLAPFDVVIFTGGCENHPEIVRPLRKHSPQAFGVPSENALRQIRDVNLWQAICTGCDIRFPETYSLGELDKLLLDEQSLSALPTSETRRQDWLVKIPSGGGLGVRRLRSLWPDSHEGETRFSDLPKDAYLQQFIRGRGIGVTAIASPSGVKILGSTEEISAADVHTEHDEASAGEDATPFLFTGCLGPHTLSAEQHMHITSMLRAVSEQVGWLGWLQMDFIEDETGQLWLLEINPRWTSGMELLHLAGTNPVSAHLHALATYSIDEQQTEKNSGRLFAKQIYYAQADLPTASVRAAATNLNSLYTGDLPPCADIPSADFAVDGSPTIRRGHPAVTLRVEYDGFAGSSFCESRAALLTSLAEVRERFENQLVVGVRRGSRT